MNRFHVHVAVPNLQESIRFYSAMFGAEPSVVKDDYAKWMLDDPRVNFAISKRGSKVGINHLGFQAETPDELQRIRSRLEAADSAILEEKNASC
jgi:catechol 2,3-dioxygenase-like lactoylglutathione lyase family enzyme